MTTAIQTRYLGPTNTLGGRIVAETMDVLGNDKIGKITVDWNHGVNAQSNHDRAAQALATKLLWNGQWVAGGTVKGYVYCRSNGAEFNFAVEVE